MLYEFENTLYQVEQLEKLPSIEEQPYLYKYRARSLLQQLLIKQTEPLYQAIIHYHLGVNYLDCEENGESRKHMTKSLNLFSQVNVIDNYLIYIQSIYNHLGFLAVNLDENEVGLAILAKAERLGNYIIEKGNFEKQSFKFEGGFSKAQEFYTITLFYIAQAYTKLGIKDKAAYYCGQTMQRQYKSKTYQLKDFVVNCISLSEYYSGIWNFAQAYYLLQIGEAVIPEGKRKKLRATIQMATGKMISDMMSYCVDLIKSNQQDDPHIPQLFNKYSLTFDEIKVKQITFQPSKKLDEIKSLFRQANTQYKRAMSVFVLDGYVTEHVQMIFETSALYQTISKLEPEANNVIAYMEKRLDILTPILNAINPKAYQNTYEKLLVEVAEINNELYEFIYKINEVDDKYQGKNKKLTEKMNVACLNTIKYYQIIIGQLKLLEEKQKDHAYHSSVTTAYFNIAKAQSKYFSKEKKEKVNLLVNSLNQHKNVLSYIQEQNIQNEFQAVVAISQEMIAILPSQIDRINYQ